MRSIEGPVLRTGEYYCGRLRIVWYGISSGRSTYIIIPPILLMKHCKMRAISASVSTLSFDYYSLYLGRPRFVARSHGIIEHRSTFRDTWYLCKAKQCHLSAFLSPPWLILFFVLHLPWRNSSVPGIIQASRLLTQAVYAVLKLSSLAASKCYAVWQLFDSRIRSPPAMFASLIFKPIAVGSASSHFDSDYHCVVSAFCCRSDEPDTQPKLTGNLADSAGYVILIMNIKPWCKFWLPDLVQSGGFGVW